MFRRIVSAPQHGQHQHKARRPGQRYTAGGRRRAFDRLRDRCRHDHRHSGTRHVHAVLGHPLAERDDAGRRSDAGEPPDRAEQVERRRPSRGICRGEQRHEAQRREDPQRIREGRDRVGLVHDRLTSRQDHHQEVAPDHDRLRQHIQDWRFRERGVNPRQQPNPVDEQAQGDHSDRDEDPQQPPSLGREITRQQQPVVGDVQHRQCRRHLFRQHGKHSARARRHRRKGSTPRTWRSVAVRRQGAFGHSGEEQRTQDEEAAQNL